MAVKVAEIGLAVSCVLFYLLWFGKKWPVCQYLFFVFATPLVSDVYVILGVLAVSVLQGEEKISPASEKERGMQELIKSLMGILRDFCVVMVFGNIIEQVIK